MSSVYLWYKMPQVMPTMNNDTQENATNIFVFSIVPLPPYRDGGSTLVRYMLLGSSAGCNADRAMSYSDPDISSCPKRDSAQGNPSRFTADSDKS